MAFRVRPALLIGIFLLTLWGVFLSACVTLYVRYGSTYQLAAAIALEISERTGMPCSISGASPGFFPTPHIILESFNMELPDGRLSIEQADLFISWKSLTAARFIPGRAVLQYPALVINASDAERVPLEAAAILGWLDPRNMPHFSHGMRIAVRQGYASVQDSQAAIRLVGLEADMRVPGSGPGYADLSWDNLNLARTGQPAFSSAGARLSLRGMGPGYAGRTVFDRLEFESGLDVDDLVRTAQLSLRAYTDEPGAALAGSLEAEGLLTEIPVSFRVPFLVTPSGQVQLPGAHLAFDRDAADLQADLALGTWAALLDPLLSLRDVDLEREPAMTGTLRVHHLSLPRWFDFARRLPSGIEAALNDLSGELNFTLTPRSLMVPRLEALLCGSRFAGSGSVPDFAKPEVRLKAHAATADVNAVFPELLQSDVQRLIWTGPAPLGGEDADEGPDYDIFLSAGQAKVWKFDTEKLSVRITPIPEGTRLHIDAGSFYGGTVASIVDIEEAVTINGVISDVDAAAPARLISGSDSVSGRVNGTAVLNGSDQSFDHFLASLSGTLEAAFTDGVLGAGDKTLDFNTLDARLEIRGPGLDKGPLPTELAYAATLQSTVRTDTWEGSVNLSGPMTFDTSTMALVRFENLPGRIQWSGSDLRASIEAVCSLYVREQLLSLTGADGLLQDGRIFGSIHGARLLESPVWQGEGTVRTGSVATLLRALNLLPAGLPSDVLAAGEISGEFTVSDSVIALSNLKGFIDDTHFLAPSISRNLDAGPEWHVFVSLGELNLLRYVPQDGSQGRDWPVDLFNGLSVRGVVSIKTLVVSKLVQRTVRIPFNLENGTLVAQKITFEPYGGQGEASLNVRATGQGYQTRLRYGARQSDSALFSREADLNTVLGGQTTLTADLNGLLRRSRDIPAALSGTWSIATTNGYIAERRSDGSLTDRIPFRSLSASGSMESGVMRSDDIELRSNALAAKGRGIINLVAWTINCRLNVSTTTFTNVPVTYTGSLDAPERSVNALNAMAGTISRMGSGLIGLVEDVLSAPFRFLGR